MSLWPVLPFSKLKRIFFGYFDPENNFLDNENKFFWGEITDNSANKEALAVATTLMHHSTLHTKSLQASSQSRTRFIALCNRQDKSSEECNRHERKTRKLTTSTMGTEQCFFF